MVAIVNQVVAYALTNHTISKSPEYFLPVLTTNHMRQVLNNTLVWRQVKFFATKKDYWYSVLIYPKDKIRLRVDFFCCCLQIQFYIATRLMINNL